MKQIFLFSTTELMLLNEYSSSKSFLLGNIITLVMKPTCPHDHIGHSTSIIPYALTSQPDKKAGINT